MSTSEFNCSGISCTRRQNPLNSVAISAANAGHQYPPDHLASLSWTPELVRFKADLRGIGVMDYAVIRNES